MNIVGQLVVGLVIAMFAAGAGALVASSKANTRFSNELVRLAARIDFLTEKLATLTAEMQHIDGGWAKTIDQSTARLEALFSAHIHSAGHEKTTVALARLEERVDRHDKDLANIGTKLRNGGG